MFETFQQFLQDIASDMSGLGKTLLTTAAIIAIAFTGISSIVGFTRGDTKKGVIYLAFTFAIIIVSVIIYVSVRGLGKGAGSDINDNYGLISGIALLPTAVSAYQYRRLQKQKMDSA